MIYCPMLFISGIGFWEILLVLAVILLLFGAKRLPEIARGLGRGMREFKKELKEAGRDWEDEDEDGRGGEGAEPARKNHSGPDRNGAPPRTDGPGR